MPYQDVLVGDLLGAILEHGVEPLLHSGAGQGIGYATELRPVAEIMESLVSGPSWAAFGTIAAEADLAAR